MENYEEEDSYEEEEVETGIAPVKLFSGICFLVSSGLCFIVGLFIYVIWGSIILQNEKDANQKENMPMSW
tara:strand:+ start:362 stop:571 length:210 start_codon:yes stop_codon:yes gene_type:complete